MQDHSEATFFSSKEPNLLTYLDAVAEGILRCALHEEGWDIERASKRVGLRSNAFRARLRALNISEDNSEAPHDRLLREKSRVRALCNFLDYFFQIHG